MLIHNHLILTDVLRKISIKNMMVSRFIKINLKTLILKIVSRSQAKSNMKGIY